MLSPATIRRAAQNVSLSAVALAELKDNFALPLKAVMNKGFLSFSTAVVSIVFLFFPLSNAISLIITAQLLKIMENASLSVQQRIFKIIFGKHQVMKVLKSVPEMYFIN